jgi:ribosome biogenesis GTPase A
MNRWVRFGTDLELLDSPGILPMRISDQTAAIKLAICDDIGERSYDFADVAAILVQMLIMHPAVGQLSNKLVANMLYVLLLVIHPQDSFVFVFLTFAC